MTRHVRSVLYIDGTPILLGDVEAKPGTNRFEHVTYEKVMNGPPKATRYVVTIEQYDSDS